MLEKSVDKLVGEVLAGKLEKLSEQIDSHANEFSLLNESVADPDSKWTAENHDIRTTMQQHRKDVADVRAHLSKVEDSIPDVAEAKPNPKPAIDESQAWLVGLMDQRLLGPTASCA